MAQAWGRNEWAGTAAAAISIVPECEGEVPEAFYGRKQWRSSAESGQALTIWLWSLTRSVKTFMFFNAAGPTPAAINSLCGAPLLFALAK
jgi:hypothetical protein